MLLNPISPGVELSFPDRQEGQGGWIKAGANHVKLAHKQEHLPTWASWKSISLALGRSILRHQNREWVDGKKTSLRLS